MRIHYIVNARVPTKKAYSIQIAKMCEAFIEAGVELELVIPRTLASSSSTFKDFYGLRVDIPVVALPGPDWYDSGTLAAYFCYLLFMASSFLFLLGKKLRGRLGTIYTVDLDTFSYTFLPMLGSCAIEIHEAKRDTFATRFFFHRAAHIIATNTEIRDALQAAFKIPGRKILVEPNGVDAGDFANPVSKQEARARLNIPVDAEIAMYAGRFYSWKGLNIVVEAAKRSPEILWYLVGGEVGAFADATGITELPPNLKISGERPFAEIALWLAAADVLVVLGTNENERSRRFTSPMKVYECMAAGRPMVVSETPALTSIIPREDAYWYEPDNASDLSQKVEQALSLHNTAMTDRAIAEARQHSWEKRAQRIVGFVAHTL